MLWKIHSVAAAGKNPFGITINEAQERKFFLEKNVARTEMRNW
jgi:hypothetical protein